MASGSFDNNVIIWDIKRNEAIKTISFLGYIYSLKYSPNKKDLIVGVDG